MRCCIRSVTIDNYWLLSFQTVSYPSCWRCLTLCWPYGFVSVRLCYIGHTHVRIQLGVTQTHRRAPHDDVITERSNMSEVHRYDPETTCWDHHWLLSVSLLVEWVHLLRPSPPPPPLMSLARHLPFFLNCVSLLLYCWECDGWHKGQGEGREGGGGGGGEW